MYLLSAFVIGKIGMQELLVILVLALLIFGPKKLPQLGKAMGATLHNFKRGMKKGQRDAQDKIEEIVEDEDSDDEEET